MKIITVIGARPQFIKAATVSRAIAQHNKSINDQRLTINEIIVHTGQHYDANMSDIFFEQMAIPKPDYHLGVGGGSHGQMTGRQLEKIEEVLLKEKPDWVLVYGDTNSTLAGALAAAKLHIPVAHVEAGLRSFNMRMPEEINRILTDRVSTLLFCPSETAVKNLIREGFSPPACLQSEKCVDQQSALNDQQIFKVGDVMYDAALFYKERAAKPDWFNNLGVDVGEYVLCTIHRAENTDQTERMHAIFQGLADAGLPVILPLHPRTRGRLKEADIHVSSNISLVDPVGYLEMVWLESQCKIVATDSGGVQKEAYFHGKPCVTLRDETEWVELVEDGWNVLAAADSEKISQCLLTLRTPSLRPHLYGNGEACTYILEYLKNV